MAIIIGNILWELTDECSVWNIPIVLKKTENAYLDFRLVYIYIYIYITQPSDYRAWTMIHGYSCSCGEHLPRQIIFDIFDKRESVAALSFRMKGFCFIPVTTTANMIIITKCCDGKWWYYIPGHRKLSICLEYLQMCTSLKIRKKTIHYILIAIYTMVNPNSNVSTHAIDIVIC